MPKTQPLRGRTKQKILVAAAIAAFSYGIWQLVVANSPNTAALVCSAVALMFCVLLALLEEQRQKREAKLWAEGKTMPNKSLQGTEGKVPSSSTAPEALRP